MAKILIVEDKVDLAVLIRSYLEFQDHNAETIHNGAEARDMLKTNSFDLIILDWDLPEVSGIDILRQLRASGCRTPVLMLTGKNSIMDKQLGFTEGADDYLTKPFNMQELNMRICALLRRTMGTAMPATTDSAQSTQDTSIQLDKTNSRAIKNGRQISLAPTEFQLIELLMNSKPPHKISKLVAAVCPDAPEANYDLLNATLRRLRNKLGIETPQLQESNFPDLAIALASKTVGHDDEEEILDPFLGMILDGKYELVELVGGGGSGVVYKANHCLLNKTVAVKMLFPHMVARQLMVRRFQQEAMATAALSHPNIIKITDFGTGEQGQPYLVMEFLEGKSLAETLETHGALCTGVALDIIIQATTGLCHAHNKGIIHRDIKPNNLMMLGDIEDTFTVKIVDFGLAKPNRQEERLSKITVTGEVFGSPAYMSPEQCRGETVDHQADIYSLGCVLFEMLANRPPFVGTDPIDVIFQHCAPEPPKFTVEGGNQEINDFLTRMLLSCLAKNKENRYQTAARLLEDLQRFEQLYIAQEHSVALTV